MERKRVSKTRRPEVLEIEERTSTHHPYTLRKRKATVEEKGKAKSTEKKRRIPPQYPRLAGTTFRQLPDHFTGIIVIGPFSFSLRDEGWLPDLKDQGDTNFCWSVSTSQLLQAIASFLSNPQARAAVLSAQSIIDALPLHLKESDVKFKELKLPNSEFVRYDYAQSTYLALKFVQVVGIALENSYRFLGYYNGPREDFHIAARVGLEDTFCISKGRWSAALLKQILIKYGCLLGTFIVDDDIEKYLHPNIYSLTKERAQARRHCKHCVLIAGAGRAIDNVEFLEIQNSYGPRWGKNGFGFINLNLFTEIQGVRRVNYL